MQFPFRQLNTLSYWIVGFSCLEAIGGFIGGIALATQTVTTCTPGFYGLEASESHPYVAFGLVVILTGVVQTVFMLWTVHLGNAVIAIGTQHVSGGYAATVQNDRANRAKKLAEPTGQAENALADVLDRELVLTRAHAS